MKTYDCFIFDFDGTLADSRINIANSVAYALKRQNIPLVSSDRIYPLIGKYNLPDTFKFFYNDLTDRQQEALLKDFRLYQKEHAHKEVLLFEGVKETLGTLQNQGKYLAILTTKHINQVSYILQVLCIDKNFAVVFGGGIIAQEKPSRECFDYIIDHLPVSMSGQKCVMIGDSTVDCETARNAHIDMIGVSHGTDLPETLLSSGALHVCEKFSEILRFI